jgi:deoxyribodipyrimidine photo-lyase
MQNDISIVWFRQDLRINDNPAFTQGARMGSIVPIYILDEGDSNTTAMGSASKIWLHHCLDHLNKNLNGMLHLYTGDSKEIIIALLQQYDVKNIFCNRCYEPWNLQKEKEIQKLCLQTSVGFQAFNGNYLWDPCHVLKDDGSYYKVFTAYQKKACGVPPRKTVKTPKDFSLIPPPYQQTGLSGMNLVPHHSWHENILHKWNIGEKAAQDTLKTFITNHLSNYKQGRDYPGDQKTSKLSPHLHFGEISPAQIWEVLKAVGSCTSQNGDLDHFLRELIWREFSCYLLYHFPSLPQENFLHTFNGFPWLDHPKNLKAWQTGHTGYPFVDAGMRELWQTGYMHNRVRMVVGSFLVKNLGIHWHRGRDWFWDCLLDADLANNSASWQWVAGCGVDAAPYFRIFNPTTQGEKFDPQGTYTRRFVPELANLPDPYLFKPWLAPEHVLQKAKILLGHTYPRPIVDLTRSRNQALDAYKKLRSHET